MLALTLADFTKALPFSSKIEDAQIQPFVELSRTLDLVPLLGYAVLEGVALLTAETVTEYAPGQEVEEGDLVSRRERIYKAVPFLPEGEEDTDRPAPPIDGATADGWAYQPLQTLWLLYLKPYWLHKSFSRFIAQHGLDITKAGITSPTDPNGSFTRPAAADKAALQAATDGTTEALRSKLTAFLRTETTAYGRNIATGYDYGVGNCAGPDAPRTRLRGINSRRSRG